MNHRDLIERLATEIQKAGATGDSVRARKLAALQREVLACMSRDMAADPPDDPIAIPPPRPVSHRERADWR